ncbi:MAG TPA: addiction module protein [Kofleriaceae bacterium]|nr:addiction module protein [Kofleriaceae bacterium]
MSPAFEALLDQVLKLPDEERGEFVSRLLRSLEPEDGDELGAQEWDAAWSAEISHRIREIRDGSVELVDGDDVLAELRAIVERP